jgi:hypothetical protein
MYILQNTPSSFTVSHLIHSYTHREYVQRAFASAITDGQRDEVEKVLKDKLTSAFNDGTAWSKDWGQESLPL